MKYIMKKFIAGGELLHGIGNKYKIKLNNKLTIKAYVELSVRIEETKIGCVLWFVYDGNEYDADCRYTYAGRYTFIEILSASWAPIER